jgi:heptosyltransferase-2
VTAPDPVAAGRVVVRPPNWLGDAVLALPAIAAVRRHFAAANLTIAAAPAVAALFRERTGADPDHVIELPAANSPAIATLRGGAFDVGVLFPNSFRSAWQFRRAGIRERWGFATSGRWLLLTKASARAPRAKGRHQADYYRALVRGLGIACDDGLPVLHASEGSRERARALLAERGIGDASPLVVFAPGAAYGQAKQWPPDRVAQVIARVAQQTDAAIALVGASHDRDAARAIESWLRGQAPATGARVVDLVGRTSLGALVGVAARASVFVSNDSGAMHVAAALGRPVVALFGPTDERATRPLGDHDVLTAQVFCRPCMLRDCPIDHRCMKRITVDQVYAAIERRLAAAAGRQASA